MRVTSKYKRLKIIKPKSTRKQNIELPYSWELMYLQTIKNEQLALNFISQIKYRNMHAFRAHRRVW